MAENKVGQSHLCIVRHGQSEWNKLNQFTGWINSELSEQGILEAKRAGQLLADNHYQFDIIFTSYLSRAIKTANIMLEVMHQDHLPLIKAWELNERHYGQLQGRNKLQAARQYGKDQVQVWRRSYRTRPDPIALDDLRDDADRYRHLNIDLPRGESLADVYERVVRYYRREIVPELVNEKKILIVAHGNSLRALIKYIESYDEDQIVKVELRTGIPELYWLDEDCKSTEPHQYNEIDDKLELINRIIGSSSKSSNLRAVK